MADLMHVLIAKGQYIGQVRESGHRLWQTVTRKYKNADAALVAMAPKMKGMKRGRILFIDNSGYYEPNIVMEINRV